MNRALRPITWLSMSYTDAVSRISQIQAQIASLQTAFDPSVTGGAAVSSGTSTSTGATGTGTSSTSFADALAQAQQTGTTTGLSSDLASGTLTPAIGSSTGVALPSSASGMLTSDQQQFASRLAADTGLDPGVVSAWLLAE
jgi:hypothetical protein